MTEGHLSFVLLVAAATVIAAIVAARLAHRRPARAAAVPRARPRAGRGRGGIRFDNAGLAEALGLGALVLILAEGGLTTNWEHARRAAAPAAVLLATVG